jgi:ERCC4-related helicase
VVGLGKTLEIGLILAELIRRGRGERILVVTPQQILEQFQQELWNRFSIPLIRLDSLGIQRIQQEIPAGRNPFTHYKRIIISIDTLKGDAYRQHLENLDWDAVVIDESHNLMGSGNFRNKLAKRLAPRTHALVLASATPHNGNAESLAELVNMLDPAAIADKHRYEPKGVEHPYIRRTKISPDVSNEIGGKWAGRGPSVPIRCPATPSEERVFAELTQTWLAGGGASKDRRLFQYTLLKAFLSSRDALAKTIGNRLKNSTDAGERTALTRLGELTAQIGDDDSAKLNALVARLKEIGVGPGSDVRVVVFSESVPTLEWLYKTLPGRLGLTRDREVDIMNGGFTDTQQQEIVKRFSLVDDPVRVLVTGDVASEGVNMHTLCHHLIHYDLPWSLIRIEQRNGRIDRYGQEYEPQFAALILTSQIEGAKDDTTVAEKLLAKEAEVHRSLGTAEAVTRLYSARKEEDRLVQDLLVGKSVDESLQAVASDDDFLAGLLNGVGDRPANPEPLRAKVPKLFKDTEIFAREALSFACPDLHIDDDGEMLAFAPPEDLISRLRALPSSYLKRHNVAERMKVTFSRHLAQRKLEEARDTKNLWPDIGYLSDLHPMIEWLTDKVLLRVVRQQAPVLIANVSKPVYLIQGVYSNALGQPTVVEWMAVTGLPDDPRISEMTTALTEAGVGPGMVNTLQFGDIGVLQDAVKVARAHLEDERAAYDALVDEPINAYRERVLTWEQASLIDVPVTERKSVRATATELNDMITKLHTAGEPLLRVLAVLDGGR